MKKSRLGQATVIIAISASVGLLAACTSSSTTRSAMDVSGKKRSKEYFAESVYGVKASPRVTNKRSRLQRGGGREQVGKPYQIRGKWYYPKEEPGYVRVGMASWYGDAFHGRLTANGEVYDMTHLTAAHPTMPLPSYARVTNTKNGASVIVRVNDRGPYSHGRVIDMSRKAAEMLDYMNVGTAQVKVEYVGRAPLDGQDESYLLASYLPGNADPSIGLPSGVLVAMNGATPGSRTSADLPGVALPDNGPDITEKPLRQLTLASMSYAPESATRAAGALNAMATQDGSSKTPEPSAEYVMVGTFESKQQAVRLRDTLSGFGTASIRPTTDGQGRKWYSLSLRSSGVTSVDNMLQAAWDAGATDALTVRD